MDELISTPFSSLVNTTKLSDGSITIELMMESDALYTALVRELDENKSLPWYIEDFDYSMDVLGSIFLKLYNRDRVPKYIDKYILRKMKEKLPGNYDAEMMLRKISKLNRKLVKLAKKKEKLEKKLAMQEAEEEEMLRQWEEEKNIKRKEIEGYLEQIESQEMHGEGEAEELIVNEQLQVEQQPNRIGTGKRKQGRKAQKASKVTANR